ncbi:Crp/Fnr family transcriptional regulator [Arcticibacter tournemirensis]
MDITLLEEKLSEYGDPEPDAITFLKEHITERTFEPNQIILRKETPNRRVYFIKEGIAYAEISNEQTERVKWLVTTGHFFTDCGSFESLGNSEISIIAGVRSNIQSLGISAFNHLLEFPRMRHVIRKIQKHYHAENAAMLDRFRQMKPLEILRDLWESQPDAIRYLKRKTLAAYLGVSRNTLTKLLKQLYQR